jgi:hypothetical protein
MTAGKGNSLLFSILCATVLLMASDYQIKTVKIAPIESYPARTAIGDVTIAADPYSTNEKSFTAFDVKKLNSHGYFPLHIIIHNASRDFLKIVTRNIILVTSSGQHLYTTPSSVLVEDVIGKGFGSRIPIVGSDDLSISRKPGSPLSDFASKELTNRVVDPGAISDGFLFFFTPQPKKNLFAGGTLYIPKLEAEGTGRSVGPFTIPLDPALAPRE